jgi:hypothetical protein
VIAIAAAPPSSTRNAGRATAPPAIREIGRAIVNFDGAIVFCLISRYQGGAFVVFSGVLNDNMQVLAVRGS